MEIWEAIRNIKIEKKITNEELVAGTGLSATTINRLLTGQQQRPSFEGIMDILDYMEIPVDQFLGMIGRKKFKPMKLKKEEQRLTQLVLDNHDREIAQLTQSYERELASLRESHGKEIAAMRQIVEYRTHIAKRRGTALFLVVAFLVIMFAVDILNPSIGFLRAALQQAGMIMKGSVVL